MARTFGQRIRRTIARGGFLVLALAAGTGVVTASTSWASGVSVESDARMMASQAASYPLAFDASLQNSLVELQANDPALSPYTARFYDSYVTATKEYGVALLAAAQVYSDNYQADQAGAKNAYIDNFSSARSTYFGKLETARNLIVSELSGNHDVAKDMFVNEYNSARDTYGNQLETVKNQIAAL